MIGIDELTRLVAGLNRSDLVRWVENRWIMPEEAGGHWQFHEVDIARIELIVQMRREFFVDDEAMPLVLGLLDQVYSLRRQMHRLCAAIERQPPATREAIGRALPPAEAATGTGSRRGRRRNRA